MKQEDFYVSLKKKVITQIVAGKNNILIWGFNEACMQLVGDLNEIGAIDRVSGIIGSQILENDSTLFGVPILPPNKVGSVRVDVLVIASDREKEELLREFASHDSRHPDVVLAGSEHYKYQDGMFEEIVRSSPVRSIAAGYPNMLLHIYQSLRYLVDNGIQGSVAEFGVYQGGTLAIVAKTLRSLGWTGKIYGFDLFGSPSCRRSVFDTFQIGRYKSDFEFVRSYCERYEVELVRGDIYETYEKLRGIPLMFSFFDTDFYSPTRKALEMCYDQTSDGGVIALDHYFSEGWEETIGERIAAREVFAGKPVFHLHGTGIFLKVPTPK